MSAIRDEPFNSDLSSNTLFQFLNNYWINFHYLHKKYFWGLKTYMLKVEKYIRIKWLKYLLNRELGLERIREKDEDFNPLRFLENSENYFEKLLKWKENNEHYCLRQTLKHTRHKKVYGTAKSLRW